MPGIVANLYAFFVVGVNFVGFSSKQWVVISH
jgi:hypothetical protein